MERSVVAPRLPEPVRSSRVHFGGPGSPPGRLRNLLAERIAAVPAGGAIDWVTYYFRDRRLAEDLVAAQRRGVEVRVTLDGHPRTASANDAVIAQLSAAIGDGLRVVRHPLDATPFGKLARPRLHEKLYCFSAPHPSAFVGSFNPSGDDPEREPEVVRRIGDQDRGYNVLVELLDPGLVAPLVSHARRLHSARHGFCDRFSPQAQRAIARGGLEIHFWPRVRPDPIVRLLRRLRAGARVRLAASHISGPTSRRVLGALPARGVAVEILAGATHRRVPPRTERSLAAAGVCFRRVEPPGGVPMHDKFALVETDDERLAIFGSFNWSEPSRRFTRELGVVARDAGLFDAFAGRWDALRERASVRCSAPD